MEPSSNKPNALKKLPTNEDSLPGPMEISQSLVSKPRIFPDFTTEETINLRSVNSPITASSVRETFFDKLKDAVLHNRLSETLKHIRTDSESKVLAGETVENRLTEVTEAHELMIEEKVPTLVWCAYCKGERKTDVKYVNSSKTFWAAVGIFFAGGVAGCCLAPYCTSRCKAVQVSCSNCGHMVYLDN